MYFPTPRTSQLFFAHVHVCTTAIQHRAPREAGAPLPGFLPFCGFSLLLLVRVQVCFQGQTAHHVNISGIYVLAQAPRMSDMGKEEYGSYPPMDTSCYCCSWSGFSLEEAPSPFQQQIPRAVQL